jgi:hypothetical protein
VPPIDIYGSASSMRGEFLPRIRAPDIGTNDEVNLKARVPVVR